MKKIAILVLVIFLFAVLFGCSGRRFIMAEKDISRKLILPEKTPYCVIWPEINPVLGRSEPGRNYYLHFENGDSYLGARVYSGNQKKFMIIIDKPNINVSQRAVISSRSGKRFYIVDSVDREGILSKDGFLVPKFDWAKIPPLKESEVEIWQGVKPGSEDDKKIEKIWTGIGEKMDRQYPGVVERVLSRLVISKDDIIIAGGIASIGQMWAFAGIRIIPIISAIIEKADLSLPYYDTALVNRFQMALEIAPVFTKIEGAVEQYHKDRALWWKKYGKEMR